VEPSPVTPAGDGGHAAVSAPRPLSDEDYALFCDEYELTMSQSFWMHDQNQTAVFELFVRHLPRARGYLVCAGLEQVLAHLMRLRFTDADIEYLASKQIYTAQFLEFLRALRFTGRVDAIAEGTAIGAEAPLLRVTAARIEATLVESSLLAIINHQTSIASKTARVVEAARGRPVWDFSLRRVHGPDAGLAVARAAYIAGAAGSATVVAGQRLGIPTSGTMAHHFVLMFGPDGEQAAFEQFLRDYPSRAVVLVDTYDTLRGVDRAIAASRATGVPLASIRLDSGDLSELSKAARKRLDGAGFRQASIIASGDLDEYRIDELLDRDAPVDSFGVGTMLGTSYDAPALGGVFKLVAQDERGTMRPVMKHSTDKETDPGVHQVFRTEAGDVLALEGEHLPGRPLLAPVIERGVVIAQLPDLNEIREHCRRDIDALPARARRIRDPESIRIRRSEALMALRAALEETHEHIV
jgi:nicotinate phosphoribosyltransferase